MNAKVVAVKKYCMKMKALVRNISSYERNSVQVNYVQL